MRTARPRVWRSATSCRRRRAGQLRQGPRVGRGQLGRRRLRPGNRGRSEPRRADAARGPVAPTAWCGAPGSRTRHDRSAQRGGRRCGRLVLPGGRGAVRQVPARHCPGGAAGTPGDPQAAPAVAAAGELTAVAGQLGITAAALALTFPLTNPTIASVLPGATSPPGSSAPTARRPASATASATPTPRNCGASGYRTLNPCGNPHATTPTRHVTGQE
jgi:hypothetical protein